MANSSLGSVLSIWQPSLWCWSREKARAGEMKEQHEIIASFCYGLIQNLNIKKLLSKTHEILKYLGVCYDNLLNLCILPSLSLAIRTEKLLFVNKAEWLGGAWKMEYWKAAGNNAALPWEESMGSTPSLLFVELLSCLQRAESHSLCLTTPNCHYLKGRENIGAGESLRTGLLLKLIFHRSQETPKINFSRRNLFIFFKKQHLIACK